MFVILKNEDKTLLSILSSLFLQKIRLNTSYFEKDKTSEKKETNDPISL